MSIGLKNMVRPQGGNKNPAENIVATVLDFDLKNGPNRPHQDDAMLVRLDHAVHDGRDNGGLDAGDEVWVKAGQVKEGVERRDIAQIPAEYGTAKPVEYGVKQEDGTVSGGKVELQKAYYNKNEELIRSKFFQAMKLSPEDNVRKVYTDVYVMAHPEYVRDDNKSYQSVALLFPDKAKEFTSLQTGDPNNPGFEEFALGFLGYEHENLNVGFVATLTAMDQENGEVEAVNFQCVQGRVQDAQGNWGLQDSGEGLQQWYQGLNTRGEKRRNQAGPQFTEAFEQFGHIARGRIYPMMQQFVAKNQLPTVAQQQGRRVVDFSAPFRDVSDDGAVTITGVAKANVVVQQTGKGYDPNAPWFITHVAPRVAYGNNEVYQPHELPTPLHSQEELDLLEQERQNRIPLRAKSQQNQAENNRTPDNEGPQQENGAGSQNDADNPFKQAAEEQQAAPAPK